MRVYLVVLTNLSGLSSKPEQQVLTNNFIEQKNLHVLIKNTRIYISTAKPLIIPSRQTQLLQA